MILETVTGTNGVIPPPSYLRHVREILDHYDILMIADKVMCGFGRTGGNPAFYPIADMARLSRRYWPSVHGWLQITFVHDEDGRLSLVTPLFSPRSWFFARA